MNQKTAFVTVDYQSRGNTLKLLDSINKVEGEFEVILVDNSNSSNEWGQYKFPLRVFNQEINKGWTGGINVALKYLLENNFDYMFVINNDSIVKQDILKQMLELVSKGANQIGVKIYDIPSGHFTSGYKRAWHTWITGQFVENKKAHNSREPIELGMNEFVDDCACFYDLNIFREIGKYDENLFLYWEDADIGMRIKSKQKFRIFYHPNAIVYHEGHGSSGKGGKSPIVLFYIARNRIIFMWKHFNISFPLFFPIFLLLLLPIQIIVNMLKTGNFSLIKYFYLGIYSGLHYPLSNKNLFLRKNEANDYYLSMEKKT